MPIVIKVSQHSTNNGNTKNMIITEVASNVVTQGSWDEVRDSLLRIIEHKSTYQDQMKSRRKTRIKGITELSNILTG